MLVRVVACFMLVVLPGVAGPITLDPDAFPAGTVITNAFAGVTLQTCDGLYPGSGCRDVRSGTDANATTGTRVFAQNTGNTTWGNGVFEFLKVSFASPVYTVSLDFFANDSSDSNPQLLVFDAAHNLIGIQSGGYVPLGSPVTLSVVAEGIRYVGAYWDELNRIENGGLDNLRYDAVPEPSSFLLVIPGLALLALARRRPLP